ncbi:MAG TPA: bacteriohemerythrin [Ruminiclostridium sp.]
MIEWKDDYLLGIEKIDEQHKKLFQIAGDIYSLMKNQLVTDKYDGIVRLISELKDYTIFHFTYEQEYMQSIGYRKYFTHKVEHDDFVEKINNVDMDKIDLDHEQYLLELMDFVVDWIATHILETDRAYTIK